MNMNNISALNPYINQAEAYPRLDARHESSRIASFHNIKNEDPVAITDPQTLRSIKDNGEKIRKEKRKIWFSFLIEFFIYVFLFAVWLSISDRPDEIDILHEHYEEIRQQAQTELSGKVEKIEQVLNEINKTGSKYDDIQRKVQREMLEYTKLQGELDSLTEKIEEYRKIKECGRTYQMTEDFTHNDEYAMKCSNSKPCYCYGRICLTGGRNCSEGNVFISGRPVCGANSGWDTAFSATIVCKELGFSSGIKTPSILKRFQKANPRNGWFYLERQSTCSIGRERSITDCFNEIAERKDGTFYRIQSDNDFCKQDGKLSTDFAKGVICKA